MSFKTYDSDNPPKRGTAKKIYQVLVARGFKVHNLHYNANNWMRNQEDGWATWACEISDTTGCIECLCGWDKERGAYLQGSSAPFYIVWLQQEPRNYHNKNRRR